MSKSIPAQHNDFFEQVYALVKLVPPGRVTSYGAIAKALGTAKSSRMVGWAMNASHKYPDIPAHRVVNRNGVLTGKNHFSTANAMEEALAQEGIRVVNDKIVNFQAVFWDPIKNL